MELTSLRLTSSDITNNFVLPFFSFICFFLFRCLFTPLIVLKKLLNWRALIKSTVCQQDSRRMAVCTIDLTQYDQCDRWRNDLLSSTVIIQIESSDPTCKIIAQQASLHPSPYKLSSPSWSVDFLVRCCSEAVKDPTKIGKNLVFFSLDSDITNNLYRQRETEPDNQLYWNKHILKNGGVAHAEHNCNANWSWGCDITSSPSLKSTRRKIFPGLLNK